MQFNKHFKQVKKGIRRYSTVFPDSYFIGKYKTSPYMACGHGCVYCDGRAERYYVEGDFQKDIVIRENLPELLKKELNKLREPGIIKISSGITDAYQPLESELELMRKTGLELKQHKFPVAVHTKSALINRDFDIWKEINDKSGFILMLTITEKGDEIRKIFEPNASGNPARFELIKKFKEAGCVVGIASMPFLPYLNDDQEQVRELFSYLKELEADFIMPGVLTLRPGKQKQFFMESLKEHYPEFVNKYKDLYSENRKSGIPKVQYIKQFNSMTFSILSDLKIPYLMPHSIFRRFSTLYDEILIVLDHMRELYAGVGKDISRLSMAIKRYHTWWEDNKRYFNRHRSMDYRDLEDLIRRTAHTGELIGILGNKKLGEFLKSIIFDRKILDYNQLELNQ